MKEFDGYINSGTSGTGHCLDDGRTIMVCSILRALDYHLARMVSGQATRTCMPRLSSIRVLVLTL